MPDKIQIPRATDVSVVKTFEAIQKIHKFQSISICSFGSADFRDDNLNSPQLKKILEKESCVIKTLTAYAQNFNICYSRGGTDARVSPYFDEIVFTRNTGQVDVSLEVIIEIVDFINKNLCVFEKDRFIGAPRTKEEGDLIATKQATLDRFEEFNLKLTEQSIAFKQQLEKDFLRYKEDVDREFFQKKENLEAENKSRQSDLKLFQDELEAQKKKFDDRDNTHVRRAIRDKMLNDVKERISQFGVSEATEKKRKPVFIGFCFLIFSFLFLIGFTFFEIYKKPAENISFIEAAQKLVTTTAAIQKENLSNKDLVSLLAPISQDNSKFYLLWVRLSVLSFGFVATIIYYIRWQNKWAEQHSASEFQLQQFYIDVNRANWVIESCLEWKKDGQGVIPSILLSSVTRNLFKDNTAPIEKFIHPADELASALLGSASKVKLRSGENEVEIGNLKKVRGKIKSTTKEPDDE